MHENHILIDSLDLKYYISIRKFSCYWDNFNNTLINSWCFFPLYYRNNSYNIMQLVNIPVLYITLYLWNFGLTVTLSALSMAGT